MHIPISATGLSACNSHTVFQEFRRTEEIKEPIEIVCCARVMVEGYQCHELTTLIAKSCEVLAQESMRKIAVENVIESKECRPIDSTGLDVTRRSF